MPLVVTPLVALSISGFSMTRADLSTISALALGRFLVRVALPTFLPCLETIRAWSSASEYGRPICNDKVRLNKRP